MKKRADRSPTQRFSLTRRQVLRGTGGLVLGLPFLPSLIPSRTQGQFTPPKRLFVMTTEHGGLDLDNMFPPDADLTETLDLYSGMQIRRGALSRRVDGSDALLSPVLTAPADALSDTLVSKMNVLRGLDIPFYIAHHRGGHLGNFAGMQDPEGLPHVPTIDQVIASSPGFYPAPPVVRSVYIGDSVELNSAASYSFVNPTTRTGGVQRSTGVSSARHLFDRLFPPMAGEPADEPRTPVVDRVLEGYRSLRTSSRRLSYEDRQRLDAHIERLRDVQSRLGGATLSCERPEFGDFPGGATGNAYADTNELYLQIVAAGLACGSTNVVVFCQDERQYTSYTGDWHNNVAHQHTLAENQARLVEANRAAFQDFVELAAQLDDIEEAPGQSVLDATWMMWSQESGRVTHDTASVPVVTFGSAAGVFATGQYLDYQNRRSQSVVSEGGPTVWGGLLYAQYLASVLHAFGIPADEWQSIEHMGAAGYGIDRIDTHYSRGYVSDVTGRANEMLPWLAS